MAGILFNRYLWLINVLRTHGPISYKSISDMWEKSPINDKPGTPLPLKTFHNHCEMISSVFGVEVVCERRNDYKYHVETNSQNDKWLSAFLDTLSIQSSIITDSKMRDRIVLKSFDNPPALVDFLEYIKTNSIISFRYYLSMVDVRKDEDVSETDRNKKDIDIRYSYFAPLGVLFSGFTWYIIGMFLNPNEKRRTAVFRMKKMNEIEIMKDVHIDNYPGDWSIRQYLDEFHFSEKDNDFVDERMVFATELGKRSDDLDQQNKYDAWTFANAELREGLFNLMLEYGLPHS